MAFCYHRSVSCSGEFPSAVDGNKHSEHSWTVYREWETLEEVLLSGGCLYQWVLRSHSSGNTRKGGRKSVVKGHKEHQENKVFLNSRTKRTRDSERLAACTPARSPSQIGVLVLREVGTSLHPEPRSCCQFLTTQKWEFSFPNGLSLYIQTTLKARSYV